jgi:hypothetical protein
LIINNQRPGVYSRYDITSAATAPLSLKYAAVAAKGVGGEAGALYGFGSYGEACGVFAPDTAGTFMREILRVLFEGGTSRVLVCPVGASYAEALAVLETADNIGAVITDATAQEDILALRAHVLACSQERKERIGFCGMADLDTAIAVANAANCERVALCHPSAVCAAALAARLLSSGDPAINLNGAAFPQLAPPDALPEATIQTLLAAGVTVFESVGGETECIRALTTRMSSNGAPDRSLSGLNTIRIIDDVIGATRATLKARLGGGRIGGSPLESIRAQAAVVLAEKKAEGLLESFAAPRCYPAPEDPAICVVEMGFKVAHVVSQIVVTAHIEV